MTPRLSSYFVRRCAAFAMGVVALGMFSASVHAQVSNTATIDAPAGVTDSNPANNTSTVVTPLAGSVVSSKSANPASGTTVAIGQTITYTLTTTVSDGALATPLRLTDVLGTGLSFGAITSAGSFSCTGGASVVCTLPQGTAIGRYSVSYTAVVNASATTAVNNSVTPDQGTCTTCSTNHPLVAVSTAKTVDVGDGTPVQRGQTLTYTVTSQITGAGALTSPLVLTDTLTTGLSFVAITNAGAFSCTAGNPVRCTLPVGTGAGSYPVSYSVLVNEAAITAVGNTVVPNEGSCTDCSTVNPLVEVVTRKSASPANGTQVSTGATITYALTSVISGGALTQPLTLTDTIGAGQTFTAVTSAGGFACNAANPLVCTLPAGTAAGTYTVTYTVSVDATATIAVQNLVEPSDGECVDCTTLHPLLDIVTSKQSDVGDGIGVQAGQTIVYTLTTLITGGGTLTVPLNLVDTLGPGLDFGAIVSAGSFSCTAGNPLTCTLPAGTGPGTYTVSYSALVQATATTQVNNSVVPDQGGCVDCSTVNPLLAISTSKTSAIGTGTPVQRDEVITYTVTTTISGNGVLSRDFTLTDTLGAGLAFEAITAPGQFNCNAANPMVCTLPEGTPAGSYPVSYSARVTAAATTSVNNSVVPSEGTCTTCSTVNPLVDIATVKTSDVGNGTPVTRGQSLVYTVTSTISGGALTRPLTLTDTLGPGLALSAVTAAGSFACNAANPLVCSLPAGTPAGSYSLSYSVTVMADAVTAVNNSVVPSDGSCATCRTDNPLTDPLVTYTKAVQLPAGQTTVAVGDTLIFTVTTVVSVAPTTAAVTLTDSLGVGLQLGTVTSAGAFACSGTGPLVCVLPANTAPGTYPLVYTAQVTAAAVDRVRNAVTGTGGDNPTCSSPCATDTPVATPVVDISKSADPGSGSQVSQGDTIAYTLTVVVANAPLTSPLVLTDTPDPGLTLGALPAPCTLSGTAIVCTLPTGTAVGNHTISYTATVNTQAGAVVSNHVTGSGGGPEPPGCVSCDTEHPLAEPLLRITKSTTARNVRIGDLAPYTLVVENVGTVNLVGGSIVDSTPAGFSFVSGSLQQDGGETLTVTGAGPIRIGNLDLPAGGIVSISYLMRVGAGVRVGTHVNQAQVRNRDDDPISNIATAQVVLAPDPLTDESLIHGSVFDDRDGDGWQDRADLTELHVQGGFAADDYIAGSTTVDRGAGAEPQSDASAPLLRGLDLGALSARQSDADPSDRHQIVISQRLRQARFADDFVLSNRQGVTVRMAADGQSMVERSGEAAKGLNAAAPSVQRRVSEGADGVTVEYVIRNEGVDERGIPGVRIASVEGLLIETDQFGRYHLAGILGGGWEHGRNFVLKIDPATLPAGAVITTDNPLLRRITPGVPVRFDWGVRMPPGLIEGGSQDVQMMIGTVLFAPGSATLAPKYGGAVDAMAEQVRGRRGEVTVSATGTPPALALARAEALKQALQQRLAADDLAGLDFVVREGDDAQAPLVAGWSEGGMVLGTLLFDNAKATIRPQYETLLDDVAAALEREGGGRVAIIGYTDVHGSYDYNTRLGLQRAKAVSDALLRRLSPAVRAAVQVQASADPHRVLDAPALPEQQP